MKPKSSRHEFSKGDNSVNITQSFYDTLASQYDKLFLDWQAATQEQAAILDQLLRENGLDKTAGILAPPLLWNNKHLTDIDQIRIFYFALICIIDFRVLSTISIKLFRNIPQAISLFDLIANCIYC